MHGVIFASFGDYVAARFGPDGARRVMADEPIYLLSDAYDDARLVELIARVAREAGIPEDDVVHDFGVFTAQTTFARLYPAFFAVAGSPRAFMLTIEERIHELDALLAAVQAAPRAALGAETCRCGAPILRGAHFCSHCGRPAAATPPVVACEHCGQPLPADVNFCAFCGNPVADEAYEPGGGDVERTMVAPAWSAEEGAGGP